MKNKLLYIVLAAISINSYAIQEFQVGGNAEVDGIISDHDASRIAIAGAKIEQVKFTSNAIKVDTDEANGQIFVYPVGVNHSKISTIQVGKIKAQTITGEMVSIFVIDDHGRSFNLRLRMQNVPSETILIKPLDGNKNHHGSDFATQVVTIIENMYLGDKASDSYVVTDYNQHIKLWKEVDFELYRSYTDNIFIGYVYFLRNKTSNNITLAENQFWKPDTVAVAIEKPVLEPGEITRVFIVGAKQDE